MYSYLPVHNVHWGAHRQLNVQFLYLPRWMISNPCAEAMSCQSNWSKCLKIRRPAEGVSGQWENKWTQHNWSRGEYSSAIKWQPLNGTLVCGEAVVSLQWLKVQRPNALQSVKLRVPLWLENSSSDSEGVACQPPEDFSIESMVAGDRLLHYRKQMVRLHTYVFFCT